MGEPRGSSVAAAALVLAMCALVAAPAAAAPAEPGAPCRRTRRPLVRRVALARRPRPSRGGPDDPGGEVRPDGGRRLRCRRAHRPQRRDPAAGRPGRGSDRRLRRGAPGQGDRAARAGLAGGHLRPRPGRALRRDRRRRGPQQGQRHPAGPRREHPSHPHRGPQLRVLQRGPGAGQGDGRRVHRGAAGPGCDGRRQALHGQQPGGRARRRRQPLHGQRRGGRAHAARDLPARLSRQRSRTRAWRP